MKRWMVWVGLVAVIAAAGFVFVKRAQAPEKATYRTEKVGKGDITMNVTATGTVSAVTTVQVGSQVSGIIAKLHADFNSRVTKGQLLAELDPTNYEAQVAQRLADVRQAEVTMRNNGVSFERQKRLLAAGLAAQGDFDAAQASYETAKAMVDQARAALTQAQTSLKYTKIVSPVDGVVVDRQYDVGQTVAASFQAPTLFTIAQDLERMQVQADVDQSDIGRVQVGQPARFTVDAYPDQEFRGTITQMRLNATVSQNVITYPVIIAVPNPGEKLRPKMTADVSIQVATVHNVLRVPNAALRFRPQETAGSAANAAAQGQGERAGARGNGGGAAGAGAGAGGAQAAERRSGGGTGEMRGAGGGPGAGGPGAGNRGAKSRTQQTVYVLEPGGALKPVQIKIGITDGRTTEVVSGDLEEGAEVVVGMPTTKADSSRGPGMRF